ncbi:MAG TPA: FecR family protein [Dongiaceae bacterium]|jgi:hypothetical protein
MKIGLPRFVSRTLLAVAFICIANFISVKTSESADFVGQATKVTGDVRVQRDGADMPVSVGTALQLGDVIRTGAGARLRVRFIDGSILTFAQTTTLSIDIFSVDPSNKSRSVILTMLQGIVDAAAAKSSENKFDYEIHTGSGYSAVRGTEWIVAAQPATTSVFVISGLVEVGANASGSKPVLVNRGNWVKIGLQTGLGPVQPTTPSVLQPMLDATGETASLNTPPAPSNTYPSQTKPPVKPPYQSPLFGVPDYSRTNDSGNNNNHGPYHDDGGHGTSTN